MSRDRSATIDFRYAKGGILKYYSRDGGFTVNGRYMGHATQEQ